MSSGSSSSTAVGIVTSEDDQYLYVWSKAVDPGAKELRFKKDSNVNIKVGAWVHFDRSCETGPDGIQTVILHPAVCMELIAPIHQIMPGGLRFWRGSCVITFSPPNYAVYAQAKEYHPGLLGLAFNDVFGHVALLDGKLRYEVGKVYKVRIRRIDRAENDVAQAVGTVFCVSFGSMLDVVLEVRDKDVRNRLLAQAPWLREDLVEEPAISMDTEVKCGCSTSSGQDVSSNGHTNGDLKGLEDVTDSKLDATPSADHHYEGIVYEVELLYVRVYVPQLRISVVALTNDIMPIVGAQLKFRLKEAEGFIARLVVPYQAIAVEDIGTATNEQLLEVHEILENDLRPPISSTWGTARGPRATSDAEQQEGREEPLYEGVVYDVQTPRVHIYVSSLRKTAVVFTNDAFQPPVGTLLKFPLKHSFRYFGSPIADSPEEIGVVDNDRLLDVMKEVYPRQEFRDPQRYNAAPPPPPVPCASLRSDAWSGSHRSGWKDKENRQPPQPVTDLQKRVEALKPTFAPPKNWNFTSTDKKATDLLGVAIAAGRGTTTFYTRLGTVEIEVASQFGVWVRMDVTLTEGRFVQGEDDVFRLEQLVPPPMDTRVIRGKRVMLAAEVEKHPDGVGNQFLGAVLDPLSLLPRDSPYGLFVAELEFEKGCFHVIKYHKPSSFGVPVAVPLQFNLFDGDYMFLVSNGYFSGRYPLLDHCAMVGFCSMLHINIVIVAIQFIWRNNLICRESSFLRMGRKWLFLPVLWCSFQLFTAVWCWVLDQEELREEGLRILRKNGWEFDNATAPYPSLIPSGAWKTRLHHSFYLLSGDISYFVIISCQISALKYIRRMGLPSYSATSKAYAEVNRGLVALAITPLMGIIPTVIMISSAALGIQNGPISAYMSIGMTAITVANPIVTIWFVRPYRAGLLHVLRINRKAAVVTPSTTAVQGQGKSDPPAQHPHQTMAADVIV